MAVNVSAWVWTLNITPFEKIVMLELADHADTSGFCFPSQRKIAERTGIARETVNRIIKRMEARGFIYQTHIFMGGQQRVSEYRLSMGIALYLGAGGCDAESPLGVTQDHRGGDGESHHIETSLETSGETSFTTASEDQSDSKQKTVTNVKLEDVDLNPKKSKQEIFDRFKLTPKGCADLWKDCHAASGEHGKCVLPSNAASSVLKNSAGKLESDTDFRKVVWGVMHDWDGFGKYCESHDDSPGYPLVPNIKFFTAHLEAAVNFTKAVAKPVQSIAKPLTKQPAPCTPIPKAKQPAETKEDKLAHWIAKNQETIE